MKWRRISPRLWRDAKVRGLSNDGKLVWVLMLTAPQTTNIPGLYSACPEVLAMELGTVAETVSKPFAELLGKGFFRYDKTGPLVWIPNALKYDPPANENVVKGWANAWKDLPECGLLLEAYQAFYSFLNRFHNRYLNCFINSFETGMPYPTPDTRHPTPEQEQAAEASAQALPLALNGSNGKTKNKPRKQPAPSPEDFEAASDLRALVIKQNEGTEVATDVGWRRFHYHWAKSFRVARERGIEAGRILAAARWGMEHPTHPTVITSAAQAIAKRERLEYRMHNERSDRRGTSDPVPTFFIEAPE